MKNFFKLSAYFILFLVVGVVAAFLFYKIISFDKTGKVPELAGLSVEKAKEALNERKLVLNIHDEEYNSQVADGYVIRQNINPGESIKTGTEVGVTVSKGTEIFSIPSFEGQVIEDAKNTLSNLKINIKKITLVHSDTVEKGRIIAQRPLSGNVDTNEVNFLVSLGPYEVSYKCPSFVNMTVNDARVLARRLGIKLVEQDRGSRIIFQKPEAGAHINKGDKVEVTLGRGWGMWF